MADLKNLCYSRQVASHLNQELRENVSTQNEALEGRYSNLTGIFRSTT